MEFLTFLIQDDVNQQGLNRISKDFRNKMSKEIYIRIRFFKASSTNFNTSFVKFVSVCFKNLFNPISTIFNRKFRLRSTRLFRITVIKIVFHLFIFRYKSMVNLIHIMVFTRNPKTGTTLTPKLSSFSFASCKIEITL